MIARLFYLHEYRCVRAAWSHRATNQALTFKAAATLPSQVVREVDPFAHFASNYRKQQGPRHLACGLAAALQESDRQLRPGGFCASETHLGWSPLALLEAAVVPFSNTPIRRWDVSLPAPSALLTFMHLAYSASTCSTWLAFLGSWKICHRHSASVAAAGSRQFK